MSARLVQFFLSLSLATVSVTAESYDIKIAADVSNNKVKEIAFVDAGINNTDSLLREIDPHVDVVIIDPQRDGVEQIAEILATQKDIAAIHILSHGRPGVLDLGATKLSAASMASNHADEMAVIRGALSQNADILIYGCNFGQDARGARAVELLAAVTGADVVASDNLTGAAALGGDWDMEIQSGTIETAQINADNWDGVLAPFIIDVTGITPTVTGTGVGDTALWLNAGTVGGTPIDLRATIQAGAATNVILNSIGTGSDIRVRTNTTTETTILWEVFEAGTIIPQDTPISGDPTFLVRDIDGAGGVPESLETIAASLTGLTSYIVRIDTNLFVSKINSTIRASGLIDAPNAQATTLEQAWVSYSWTGVSSWEVTYQSYDGTSSHDYIHDGNGDFVIDTNNDFIGDPVLPVVFITSASTANAANSTTYPVSGSCSVGDGNVTVAITGAGTPPPGQSVTCSGAGALSATFDVSLITDGINAITINASQTDASFNTGNAPTVQVNKDDTVPVITLLGSDPVNIELGTAYVDAGATASDNIDGDITGSIVTVNPVNINIVGTYIVTYNVQDAALNAAAQVTRTVNVTPDMTVPVITRLGSDPVNIELGTAYVDVGATASDNIDGDITGSIVTVNPVNINIVGTYIVTYNVQDAALNAAAQVTRTVNVTADVTLPVITRLGSDPVNIELGTAYVDAGASAVDNIDGDITGSIVTVNPVNINAVGTYIVTYNVQDAALNAAVEVTRTVNVTADVTLPVITLFGSDPVNIELGTAYVDAGASAVDNIDGSITGSIVTVNPVNINAVGTYIVTYNVQDAALNAAVEVTRTVNVTADVTAPVITRLGSDPVIIELGTAYADAGATASDSVDGDISGSIVVAGDVVDINTIGTYVITYNVQDAALNAAAEVTRTVSVTADVTLPVITRLGSTPVNIELGTAYVDAGATASDNIDGDITGSIVVAGDVVDINTVGTYVITYNVSDAALNAAVEVTRTVNVTPDVTLPVITRLGSTPVNIELGTAYADAGATASDNIDGDITGSIVVAGDTVNVSLEGTYVITYNVSDAAGNPAAQVTRTVNVTPDVTLPVITLFGSDPVNIELGTAYVDEGASAFDNFDGSITGSIVVAGDTVNVSLEGAYVITYNVSDAAGNPAAQVTRTVNVTADVTLPVITRLGSDPVNIELGTAYVDAGATASDNIDGDITGSIVVAGDVVDINTVGTYVITYNVSDAALNAAVEVTRTVNVTADVTAPVISLLGSTPVSIELGTAYADAGATASDSADGDISGSIVVAGDTVNVNLEGAYVITYNVSDAASNAATQVTRTVNVVAADGIPDSVECVVFPTDCPDSDGDGLPDYTDTDSDNDGISDMVEAGVDPANPIDTDGDGIPDYLDMDSDGDGDYDLLEGTGDTDNDGIPDYLDADSPVNGPGDSDSDGIPDSVECPDYVPLGCLDTDNDGSPDYMDADSDNDGIDDAIEVNASGFDDDGDGIDNNFDTDNFTLGVDALDQNADGIIDRHPLDSDGDGTPDYQDTDSDNDLTDDVTEGVVHTDGDGIPDYVDVDISGALDGSGDSDGDGRSDFDECSAYPACADADADGKPDYLDNNHQDGPLGNIDGDAELNYLDPDDDGDGIPDSVEDLNFDGDNNPYTNPHDTDGNGIPDYQDDDSDGDGTTDAAESGASGIDADGDNIDDSYDIDITGGTDANGDGIDDNVTPVDTDGDGIPDYVDADDAGPGAGDSDGDGASDSVECPSYPACAASDGDNDGIPNYMDKDTFPAPAPVPVIVPASGGGSAGSNDPFYILLMLLTLVTVRYKQRTVI